MPIPRDEYGGASRDINYTMTIRIIGQQTSGAEVDLLKREIEKLIERANFAVGHANALVLDLTESP